MKKYSYENNLIYLRLLHRFIRYQNSFNFKLFINLITYVYNNIHSKIHRIEEKTTRLYTDLFADKFKTIHNKKHRDIHRMKCELLRLCTDLFADFSQLITSNYSSAYA